MRIWYIGCAPAFQAGEAGSIPVIRSGQLQMSSRIEKDNRGVMAARPS